MKNKKGFTFIELIAVITVIGILALFALPTIEKLSKENNEKIYQQQLNNIILSLKSWASDNRIYLPEEENENLTITLGNLKSEGYIEYEVKNPLTGNCFDNSMALIITKVKKNYDYSIDLDTIKESDNCEVNLDSPVIALNGNMIENIEVNSIYVDKGVIAKDKDGNNITNNVVMTISGSGNAVDTSKIGNQYIITYLVTDNDITVEVSRMIKIVDTIAPELIIPGDVKLGVDVASFNVMEGVSAVDNSGEVIDVESTYKVVFGTIGKYTVTYTAYDSSGNTSTKKRIISIEKYVNGIMSSDSNCINEGICEIGTKINVQVNSNKTYDFHVIKDTGTQLTLIMDRNLGTDVAWYTSEEHNNTQGPLTALDALENKTSGWVNVPTYSYTLQDDGGGNKYSAISRTNVRARLLSYTEASEILALYDGEMPTWLYGNLKDVSPSEIGYWLSSAYADSDYYAYVIYSLGEIAYVSANVSIGGGVRPVIILNK